MKETKKQGPCTVLESFDKIGSKWKLIIINDLQEGEKRFNELKRSTDASSRTLSRVLKELQADNIVNKRVEQKTPVSTHYSLTPRGKDLKKVFQEINDWAEKWLEQ